MKPTLVCGVEVTYRRSYLGQLPAHVHVHILGSNGSLWLTADEARKLALALVQAAEEVERDR